MKFIFQTHLLFLILLCLGINKNSSAQLTNQDVYDYTVGQVMQVKYNYHDAGFNSRDSLITFTILSKTVSLNSDTITYQVNKSGTYQFFMFGNSGAGSFNQTGSLTFTDLGQNVVHPYANPCGEVDSLTSNSCGAVVWKKIRSYCYSPYYHGDVYFVKGFGGPYYNVTDHDASVFYSYILNYYNNGTDSCGMQLTGTNEVKDELILSIYPNPAEDHLNITSSEKIQSVRIIDLFGSTIGKKSRDLKTISVENIPAGVYNLLVEFENGKSANRKFVVK